MIIDPIIASVTAPDKPKGLMPKDTPYHDPDNVRIVHRFWKASGSPADIGEGYFKRVLEGINTNELLDLRLQDDYEEYVKHSLGIE